MIDLFDIIAIPAIIYSVFATSKWKHWRKMYPFDKDTSIAWNCKDRYVIKKDGKYISNKDLDTYYYYERERIINTFFCPTCNQVDGVNPGDACVCIEYPTTHFHLDCPSCHGNTIMRPANSG